MKQAIMPDADRAAEETRRREVLRGFVDRLSTCRDDLAREKLTAAATMTEIVILTLEQAIETSRRRPATGQAGRPLH